MSSTVRPLPLLPPNGWRGLVRLALEGLATGLFVSAVLAIAVFIVAVQAEAAPPPGRAAGVAAHDAHGGGLELAATETEPALGAPLVATEVKIDVAGVVARTTVKQRFINPTPVWREGVYRFALPDKAAVDRLRVESAGRVIEGQVRERSAAKKDYETAKREGRQAGLVDQERPNLFTTSVAHLPPGEEVVVTIEYQEVLRVDSGTFRLRFPMAVTPRYIPGEPFVVASHDAGEPVVATDAVPDASRVVTAFAPPASGQLAPVALDVIVDAGFPLAKLESTTHAIRVDALAGDRARVRFAEGVVAADRDLELAWTPAVGAAPGAAVFTETRAGRTHALVMLLPPSAAAQDSPMPREATFVVDTSGSMSGVSIAQAKDAVQFALARLNPGDRFNVIEFNSRTRALWSSPMPVDATTIAEAQRFVAALRADGGTEMKQALAAALAPDAAPGYARQVFFLTDGAVGNEHELLKLVREKLGDRRLYTIAIGPAPNAWFIRKAAQFGRGTSTFIGDVKEVREKMTALFEKLERPALTDLSITWPVGAEVYPHKLPDLYAGEPIVVSAAFSGSPTTLSVIGRQGSKAWGQLLPLGAGRPANGIGALWARERISTLSDTIVEGAPEDEVKPLIVATALEHHLVSKYTSLVAVDVTPIAPVGTTPTRTDIPGLLPAGLDPAGFVGGLPRTATAWQLLLIAGAALLALATMLRPRRRSGIHRGPVFEASLRRLVARAELARRVC